jgi:hypothetical protein
VIPLLLVTAAAGCLLLGRVGPAWMRYASFVPFAGLLMFSNLRLDAAAVRSAAACDRSSPTASPACFPEERDRAFFAATQFAADSTPPGALFVTPKEHTFYFYSGKLIFPVRRALALPAAVMLDSLRANGVEYLVLAPLGPVQQPYRERLLEVCGGLEHVRQFVAIISLFRIRHGGEAVDTEACGVVQKLRMVE